jgi:hypothetical protein
METQLIKFKLKLQDITTENLFLKFLQSKEQTTGREDLSE